MLHNRLGIQFRRLELTKEGAMVPILNCRRYVPQMGVDVLLGLRLDDCAADARRPERLVVPPQLCAKQ